MPAPGTARRTSAETAAGVSAPTAALDAAARAGYANGNSSLTQLSQLGVVFHPVRGATGSSLSIDLGKLESPFGSDGAGAFGILSQAATARRNAAGNFVDQAGKRASASGTLTQASLADQPLTDSLPFQTPSASNFGLPTLSTVEALSPAGSGASGAHNAALALNQFALVSQLIA